DVVEVPGAARAQREAAAELVFAQAALHDHDAVAGQQRRVLHPRLREEGALDPAAAGLQHHEGLALAALADAGDLAGDHGGHLLAPAAAAAFAVAAAAPAGRGRLPERVELPEVAAHQGLQLVAVGVERVPAEVVAERFAFAGEFLRQRP